MRKCSFDTTTMHLLVGCCKMTCIRHPLNTVLVFPFDGFWSWTLWSWNLLESVNMGMNASGVGCSRAAAAAAAYVFLASSHLNSVVQEFYVCCKKEQWAEWAWTCHDRVGNAFSFLALP